MLFESYAANGLATAYQAVQHAKGLNRIELFNHPFMKGWRILAIDGEDTGLMTYANDFVAYREALTVLHVGGTTPHPYQSIQIDGLKWFLDTAHEYQEVEI